MKAIHPGEMVRAGLKERGWTQGDLAAILGRSESQVNRLITGRAGVSIRTARELGQAFGTTPMLWLTAWNDYRLAHVKARPINPPVKRWSWDELEGHLCHTCREVLSLMEAK